MQTVQKQALPVILDENGNPLAIIYFNKGRDRIIYMLQKADEEELIALLTPQITTLDGAGKSLDKLVKN